MKTPATLALILSVVLPCAFADLAEVSKRMSESATTFLDSLDSPQLAKASYPFSDDRKSWHFVPRNREGLSLGEMSVEQQAMAFSLIGEGLSAQGVQTVKDVISLEDVLRVLEGEGRSFPRTPDLYHVWIFGDPKGEAWGWRFEGHHISINATVIAGEGVSMTPTFLGANPAEIPSGERKGFRALPSEEDVAFRLVLSLSEQQKKKAVFRTRAPSDIFTSADRAVKPLPIEGLKSTEMSEGQRQNLKELVDVFLKRNQTAIYNDAIALVESGGWDNVIFGWAGPLERHEGNYYFVQGPGFLIEYDNTQNNNNHIHCVWREFDGDFGEDLLSKHHHDHTH